MTWQPHLEGELVRLIPLEAGHFELLYAAASDPEIWELHPEKFRYQRPVFEGFFASAIESGGAMLILDRVTGEVIGSSRFYDHAPNRVRIGFTFLKRSHWGGLYNRELKCLMLRHAFQFVEHAYFDVGDTNYRSQQAMEKIGAQVVERTKRDDGSSRGKVVYRISREDATVLLG